MTNSSLPNEQRAGSVIQALRKPLKSVDTMAKVEIYASPHCIYCRATRRLLKKKRVKFEEYNVLAHPELLGEMIERSDGVHTVPQIFIDSVCIGGYDDLAALDEDETLDKLLMQQK